MIPGWKEEIEGEYLEFLRQFRKASPADFVAHLGVSECCVIYWLTGMAREGRIRILAFEPVEKGGVPCDQATQSTSQRVAFYPTSEEAPISEGRG